MKYALISEEQIQEIKSRMHPVRNSYAGETTLAIIQSLKPQEPVAWWERDADTGNWFLTPSFNERAETEPLFYLGDADE